jgi:hypothetical protein
MLEWFKRYRQRRRLRRLLSQMPWLLLSSYGGKRSYTYGQVRKCHESLKLHVGLLTTAAAAYCSLEEFVRNAPGASEYLYRERRGELCDLFDFDDRDLNAEGIRKRRVKQSWNAAPHDPDPFGGAARPGDSD